MWEVGEHKSSPSPSSGHCANDWSNDGIRSCGDDKHHSQLLQNVRKAVWNNKWLECRARTKRAPWQLDLSSCGVPGPSWDVAGHISGGDAHRPTLCAGSCRNSGQNKMTQANPGS